MSLDDAETEELVQRAADGDHQAGQLLLSRHRNRLRRMVAVRLDQQLAARVDPSDVVQEAMMEAASRLSEYLRTQPLPFYPWLRQIAWERLVDLYHRHTSAQKRSVLREEPQALNLPDQSAMNLAQQLVGSQTSPSQHLLREEMRQRVRDALSKLSAQDRELLVMRHLEQMQVSEIAAVLNIRAGAVKMRRLRAIERLRALLGGALGESQP